MRTAIAAAVLAMVLLGLADVVPAQDVTAEVRTWSGQTVRLSQPTLEIFYTLLPQSREVPGAPADGGSGTLPGTGVPAPGGPGYGSAALPGTGVPEPPVGFAGGYDDLRVSGSMASLGSMFGRNKGGGGLGEIATAQGRRQRDTILVYRGSVEMQVPLANLVSLTFTRQPAKDGITLPPYVLPGGRFQYAATAVLIDGSRVEGDYINLGTTLLRGTTPQGRVDIPWEDIAVIRFTR